MQLIAFVEVIFQKKGNIKSKTNFLFRPHLWGEELYTQMGFFVQTILADRHIHRREMSGINKKLVQRRIRN